jgi:hypothetical protein
VGAGYAAGGKQCGCPREPADQIGGKGRLAATLGAGDADD